MAEMRVQSEITGSVWKVLVRPGDTVEEGSELVVLESMKMEIPVVAPVAGTVTKVLVAEGDSIGEGGLVAIIATT
jgi:acetyl-CoA carboxylase biotin carboxyl carrier protein